MIDVQLKTTEPETVAYIAMQGAYAQIPEAMGRLYGWIAQRGLQPVGMPMTVYLTEPDAGSEADARWQLMAPIAGDPEPSEPDEDGCGIRRIEPHLIASTVYQGPYERIGGAYRELEAWVAANAYELNGPPGEAYLNDPATTHPEEYLTEIRFPIAKR